MSLVFGAEANTRLKKRLFDTKRILSKRSLSALIMRASSANFLTFLVIVSFSVHSLGLPLPDQNVVVEHEAAPLEAEDDPARLRRYHSYGLRQAKLQGVVQPASNVHPDAAPYINTAGTGQMSAMPAGAAQPNTDASALYGEMRRTAKTNEAPSGGEASSQTGGMLGLSDRATNQYGTTQAGRDFSDNTRAIGPGVPGVAVPDVTSQTSQEPRGFAPSAGISASSSVGLETPELVDYASRESEVNKAAGAASPPFGTGVAGANLAEAGVMRQTMPEPERQGAQTGYGLTGNMGGPTLAQSNVVYNGEKRPSLPLVARVDENGIPTVSQRTRASGTFFGSRANGLYAEHGPSMYVGSGGQPA